VLSFYLPISICGLWLDSHAYCIRRDIKRRMTEARGSEALARAVGEPVATAPGSGRRRIGTHS
jgi:hypothetical protein